MCLVSFFFVCVSKINLSLLTLLDSPFFWDLDFCSIEEFIPLLKERMNVLNPYVRQFLVGWITVLDSVPDIDMLGFLPDFLDGNCTLLTSARCILPYSSLVICVSADPTCQ